MKIIHNTFVVQMLNEVTKKLFLFFNTLQKLLSCWFTAINEVVGDSKYLNSN